MTLTPQSTFRLIVFNNPTHGCNVNTRTYTMGIFQQVADLVGGQFASCSYEAHFERVGTERRNLENSYTVSLAQINTTLTPSFSIGLRNISPVIYIYTSRGIYVTFMF